MKHFSEMLLLVPVGLLMTLTLMIFFSSRKSMAEAVGFGADAFPDQPLLKVELDQDTASADGNLLPEIRSDYAGPIGAWSVNVGKENGLLKLLPSDGVDGSDACTVSGSFRLSGIKLLANETYRFGAYVRTRDFRNAGSTIIIYNYKWQGSEARTAPIPTDTQGKWVKLEAEAVMPTSQNGQYTFQIYAPTLGSLDICRPFIYGVSERARRETEKTTSLLPKMRRLIPITPLLHRLEAAAPKLLFSYVCPLPGKESDYEFRMRVAANGSDQNKWYSFPVPADRQIHATCDAVSPGPGKIEVLLVRKADGAYVLANQYEVNFLPPLPALTEKRLNNLVTELIRQPLANGKISFVNPREGWVYIGFDKCGTATRATLNELLDAVKWRPGEGAQTMRYLTRGKHTLTVFDDDGNGEAELIIRTVPEIMIFPLEVMEQNQFSIFRYDRDFFRKHFWNTVNTYFLLFGWNPKTAWEESVGMELTERGIKRMGSDGFHGYEWMDRNLLVAGLKENFPTATTEGRAVDETVADADPELLDNYAEACWEFTGMNKFIYLWLAHTRSYLNYAPYHLPLISAASNIGQGRGKLLMETYVETTPDLKSLEEYYQLVRKHLVAAQQGVPDAAERMMLIMSGLLTAGAWNCNSYPESDIKYALDYFFHLVATVPEAKGLYGVGCYNIRYADEENARWIGRLLRHYAVEGKTEMLSPRYGISYNPGHVTNGDFKLGLEGWRVTQAQEGSIKVVTVPGYGFSHQRRRGIGYRNGDTAAEITRNKKTPNLLSQTMRNFIPGELYSLSFVTADADDVKNRRKRRADYTFTADLEGAERIPELGYIFRNPPGEEVHRTEIITQKIVFKALRSEINLTISDWQQLHQADEDFSESATLLNFVNVNRYYPDN